MKRLAILSILLILVGSSLPALAALCASFHEAEAMPSSCHQSSGQHGNTDSTQENCPICALQLCDQDSSTLLLAQLSGSKNTSEITSQTELNSSTAILAILHNLPQPIRPPPKTFFFTNARSPIDWQATYSVFNE